MRGKHTINLPVFIVEINIAGVEPILSHQQMGTAVNSAVDSILVRDEWKSIALGNNGSWWLEVQILCALL